MPGWFRLANILASRSNRARSAGFSTMFSGRTLRATTRSTRASRARHTSPIPPAPIQLSISYGPRRVPGARLTRGQSTTGGGAPANARARACASRIDDDRGGGVAGAELVAERHAVRVDRQRPSDRRRPRERAVVVAALAPADDLEDRIV